MNERQPELSPTPGVKVFVMCLAFIREEVIATIAFPVFIIACIIAALYIKDRNKRL